MKTWLGILLLLGFTAPLIWAGNAGGAADDLFDPNTAAKAQGSGSTTNTGATLFPTPVLLVTPAVLEFGPVVTNKSATNTFLVENVGRGKVSGKATVSAPFKIVEGGSYTLTRREKQVVTVVYSPLAYTGSNDVRTITFGGAGVAKATVVGTAVKARVPPNSRDR